MPDESRSLLLQARVHRRLGAAARLALAFQLSEFTRQLALAGLRNRFPTRTDAELRRELLRAIDITAEWERARRKAGMGSG